MMPASSAKALQVALDAACASGRVDAASLAIHARGDTEAFAAGMANLPEEIAATPETLFHIGSTTKAITAELIWRLITQDRLSVDLPLIDALPEVSHLATLANRRLTIGHLLSHTGGLDGDVFFEAGRGKDVLRRFLSQIQEIGSLFTPGAHFSYANVGFNILARVVEACGGSPFEDALGDLLRKTHELSRVGILPEDKIRQRTALHFTRDGEGWQPSHFGPYSNIGSGTILAMSMADLARWGAKLATGDVVRPMTAPAVRLPFNHRYEGWGYGVSLLDDLGATLFGHDGGTAGTATFLRIAPKTASSWAFAATGSGGLALHREIEPLIREVLRLEPASQRRPEGKTPRDLKPYEGNYARHGMVFTTKAQADGTLRLTTGGSLAGTILNDLTLRPLSANVFECRLPILDAKIWTSFHDFDGDRPRLFFALERMARRTEEPVP